MDYQVELISNVEQSGLRYQHPYQDKIRGWRAMKTHTRIWFLMIANVLNLNPVRLIRMLGHVCCLIAMVYIPATEVFAASTSGEFLRIYDASNRTSGDGRTVPHDSHRVFADFRYRDWRDDYYEWVSVRLNGGPESARTPIATLQRMDNTINWIPVDVNGQCGDVEAVLWTGRHGASPVRSDAFHFNVDCELPRITIRGYELGGPGGGTYVSPREIREGQCLGGAIDRFDIQVQDNMDIRSVATTLEGRALETGGGRIINYDNGRSAARRDISFQRVAQTPFSTRPNEDSRLSLTVDVVESSGRLTQRNFYITLGGKPAVDTRVDRPTNGALIPFNTSWQIDGHVSSRSCAFQPDHVELWHTIPGGVAQKIREARVDRAGRFSIPMAARTIPVGNNGFNIRVPLPRSSAIERSVRNDLEVQITPLTQETVKKIQPPTVPGIQPHTSGPDRSLMESTPQLHPATPAADEVKKQAQHPAAQEIQKKSLSEPAIQGISP